VFTCVNAFEPVEAHIEANVNHVDISAEVPDIAAIIQASVFDCMSEVLESAMTPTLLRSQII
jgi:hypothetical protein